MTAAELVIVLRLAELGLTSLAQIIAQAKADGATDEQLDAARADLLAIKARREGELADPA